MCPTGRRLHSPPGLHTVEQRSRGELRVTGDHTADALRALVEIVANQGVADLGRSEVVAVLVLGVGLGHDEQNVRGHEVELGAQAHVRRLHLWVNREVRGGPSGGRSVPAEEGPVSVAPDADVVPTQGFPRHRGRSGLRSPRLGPAR